LYRPGIRKIIILSASCFFYAFWDWHFLGLLAAVTVVDFFISRYLAYSYDEKIRKILLAISIIFNLGLLGLFKYFNFFIDNLNFLLSSLGLQLGTLNIILPVGISFYIFETLSYVIDVYRRTAQPAASLVDYAVFITFFPRLVAGPIMRASRFLPQLERGVQLNVGNFVAGAQLFAQGLIKKVIIADRLSVGVDIIYSNPAAFSCGSVWLAVFAYSIQIYFDFSGYSDMAIGIARIMGFDLDQNFNLPYVAQSISEFWRRWHISLSTWLRDYLYIPLGGNRKGTLRTYVNLMLTMLLGGLWHGASWNFVIWGGLHGLYLAGERIAYRDDLPNENWNSPFHWLRAGYVFVLVSLTWIFFRSPSLPIASEVFSKLFFIAPSGIQWFYTPALLFVPSVIFGGLFLASRKYAIPLLTIDKPYAIPLLVAEYFWVYLFFPADVNPFIYFQF
jgi:alginate O-acetyltransferase complex protein AlgI